MDKSTIRLNNERCKAPRIAPVPPLVSECSDYLCINVCTFHERIAKAIGKKWPPEIILKFKDDTK